MSYFFVICKLKFDDIDVMLVFNSFNENPASLKQNIMERNRKKLLTH